MNGFTVKAISIDEEVEKLEQFKQQQLDRLKYFNEILPKDPEAYALKLFLEKFGHEYVDVPVAADAANLLAYSRYSLRYFLQKLISNQNLNSKGE